MCGVVESPGVYGGNCNNDDDNDVVEMIVSPTYLLACLVVFLCTSRVLPYSCCRTGAGPINYFTLDGDR